jgi:putative transcriptional regulator
MVLRNRVKELRARHNINQAELGKLVDASRQTISLIERGDYSPSVLLALRIAKVLKVNVEEVFYLEEEK